MKLKKSPKADLERKRFAFFQIGLILAGSLCLAAFEYTSPIFSDIDQNENKENPVLLVNEIPKDIVYKTQPQKPRIQRLDFDQGVNPTSKPIPKAAPQVSQNIIIDLKNIPHFTNGSSQSGFVAKSFDTLDIVGKMPEFPGGELAMRKWIAKNIKLPEYGQYGHKASGIIYVHFVVNTRGEIVDIKIGKGIAPEYDKAALAVIGKMPKWKPGEQLGKRVPVRVTVPINVVKQ